MIIRNIIRRISTLTIMQRQAAKLSVCAVSDLPCMFCAHCQPYTPTDAERRYVDAMTPVTVQTPRPAGSIIPLNYQSEEWAAGSGKINTIVCDHETPDDQPLCTRCLADLAAILEDTPRLLADLTVHLTRQTSFLELGTPTEADPDEGVLPWSEQAARAIRDLWRAFGGRPAPAARHMLDHWPTTTRLADLPLLASRISYAAGAARQVIDAPRPKVYYGPCPRCGLDIMQERVGEGEWVRCNDRPCGYRAKRADHLTAELDIMADKEFTLTMLVRTLCDGGEPTTRQEIENLIYRANGDLPPLPRDRRSMPRWVGNRLEANEVWMYRLGTVREFLAEKRSRA